MLFSVCLFVLYHSVATNQLKKNKRQNKNVIGSRWYAELTTGLNSVSTQKQPQKRLQGRLRPLATSLKIILKKVNLRKFVFPKSALKFTNCFNKILNVFYVFLLWVKCMLMGGFNKSSDKTVNEMLKYEMNRPSQLNNTVKSVRLTSFSTEKRLEILKAPYYAKFT